MERDWPEGRGIFHNKDKTFLTWVSENYLLNWPAWPLFKSGERRGSAEDHLDGDGRRREGRLLEAGQRHQGCRGQRQEGVWQVGTSLAIVYFQHLARVFLNIWQEYFSLASVFVIIVLAGSSCSTPSTGSSTPARPTWAPGWEHPSTLTCLDIPRRDFLLSRPGLTQTHCLYHIIWDLCMSILKNLRTRKDFNKDDELYGRYLWTILRCEELAVQIFIICVKMRRAIYLQEIYIDNLKVWRAGCAAAWYQRRVWWTDRLGYFPSGK